MEQLKSYVYIDANGIDSLLAQITPEVVEESQVQTTKRNAGTVKGTVGFSNLLKQFFNADINASGERETIQTVSQKTVEPYEAKIQRLITFIREHGALFSSIDEVYSGYDDGKQNFICEEILLDTDFDHDNWEKSVETAKQFGYFTFYKGGRNGGKQKPPVDSYSHDDTYFKQKRKSEDKIVMNMSLQKMDPLGGVTSHFSYLLKATKGVDIPLGVFGHVYRLASSVYQIKPYAVWRTSKYLGF